MGENMEMNSSPSRGRLSLSRSAGYLAESAQRETGITQAASAGDVPRGLPFGENGEAVSEGSHIASDPGMMTSTSQPAIIRSSNWRNRLMSQTFNFFGVGDNCQADQQRWRLKSTRHMSRRHGGIKPEFERDLEREEVQAGIPQIVDPLARPRSRDELDGPRGPLPSQLSTGTASSTVLQKQYSNKIIRQRSKRQSVAKMGWEVIRQSVRQNRSLLRSVHTPSSRPPLVHSRSFAPASLIADTYDDEDEIDSAHFFSPGVVSEDIHDDVFFDFSPPTRRRDFNQAQTLPRIDSVTSDRETASAMVRSEGLRESMSLPGFMGRQVNDALDRAEEKEEEKRRGQKRHKEEDEEEDEVESGLSSPHVAFSDATPLTEPGEPPPTDFFDYVKRTTPGYSHDGQMTPCMADMIPTGIGWRKKAPDDRFNLGPLFAQDIPDSASARQIRRNKIHDKIMQSAIDNSNRREIGKGLVGRVLNRNFRSKRMDSYVQRQIEEIEDHRPYFTYWVTTVQVIIMIVSIAFYGFAPIGFNYTQRTKLVLQTNLVMETVGYMEPDNFWIGPRPADLVHLGAKYAPCMHRDEQIYEQIQKERQLESQSGCCIRTDGAGCLQTLESECSTIFATFHKWPNSDDPSLTRTSGPVCGQDPRECLNPLSTPPYEWPDNISDWEICKEFPSSPPKYPHTTCTLTGRPCCIGIQGECHIVSPQYCAFVNGFYHEEATLCSQVDCLDDICGLLNFVNTDYPDQFYRLWLSIFMHAGIFHCILTVIMQMTILRDLEKLAGWFRIGIIYIFSGIGGNLTSAIFIPFRAEVGPAGAQFGLLACLVVEVLQSWQMLKSPFKALGKLLSIIGVLFVLGLLPWIDNFAHLGGFICGILLSFIFLPYICFGDFDKRRKRIQIFVCTILLIGYFILTIVLFYITPVRNCSWCHYFNCIPITEDFCNDMELRLEDRSTTL